MTPFPDPRAVSGAELTPRIPARPTHGFPAPTLPVQYEVSATPARFLGGFRHDRILVEWVAPTTARGAEPGAPALWSLVEPCGYVVPDYRLPRPLQHFTVEPPLVFDFASFPRGVGVVADLVDIRRDDLACAALAHDSWQKGRPLREAHPEVTDLDVDRLFRSVLKYQGYDEEKTEKAFLAVRGHSVVNSTRFERLAKYAAPIARLILARVL